MLLAFIFLCVFFTSEKEVQYEFLSQQYSSEESWGRRWPFNNFKLFFSLYFFLILLWNSKLVFFFFPRVTISLLASIHLCPSVFCQKFWYFMGVFFLLWYPKLLITTELGIIQMFSFAAGIVDLFFSVMRSFWFCPVNRNQYCNWQLGFGLFFLLGGCEGEDCIFFGLFFLICLRYVAGLKLLLGFPY